MNSVTKLKVVTVVGTRPEIIRLSRVINALDESEVIEQKLVHTGQNYDYELNQIFFDEMSIRKPDHFLNAAGKNAADTIGNVISKIDDYLEVEKPDAFLVLGDTNSCLAAISAKKRKIPIFHMEAGNRCFDQRVPEETNRKIVDHISDINLPYSTIARSYLVGEGFPPDRIIKTGSPMYEVLEYNKDKILKSDVLKRLGLENEKYFLVSAHREENVGSEDMFINFINSLNNISSSFNLPIVVSTHPRTRKVLDSGNYQIEKNIKFLNPLGFIDYNKLQMCSLVVLSDSGTISEESSILNFRALNIREAHERPEAMEEASVMMVGLSPDRVYQGIIQVLDQPTGEQRKFSLVNDYSSINVSSKIVRVIISYVDYVNRVVWSKK